MTLAQIPQSLIEALSTGQVIPFVGAGLSLAVTGHDGKAIFPTWQMLLESAAAQLEQERKAEDAKDVRHYLTSKRGSLLTAAEIARDALGNDAWCNFLKKTFDRPPADCDHASLRAARAVWQLGSSLVVTTNYDHVLDWAFQPTQSSNSIPEIVRHWDIESAYEQANALSQAVKHPTIWHLHGRIDNVNKLILSPDGYTALYGDTESQYQTALATLQTLLASRPFLFIGFSFADQVFSEQLRAMADVFKGCSKRHYVLVKTSQVAAIDDLNLPLECIAYTDHTELPDILQQLAAYAAKPGPAEPAPASESTARELAPVTASKPTTKAEAAYSLANRPFNVPFRAKGAGLVGRTETLLALRRQLCEGKATSIGHAAAFRGIGGLGKTQLAVEYAHQYQQHYPNGVIWLVADQDLPSQLIELALKSRWIAPGSEKADVLTAAMQRLKNYDQCLIIFDNVDSLAQIEAYLPDLTSSPSSTASPHIAAHILATSRELLAKFAPIPLGLLTVDESLMLLTSEAGVEYPQLSPVEQAAAKQIVNQLGNLPLAIEIAGAFMKQLEMPFADYGTLLTEKFEAAVAGQYLDSYTQHEQNLYVTLLISERQFASQPLLKAIINVLSFSGAAAMGNSLLAQLLAVTEVDLIESLAYGAQLKLLTVEGDHRYSLHRLVSQIHRDSQPLTAQKPWAAVISQRLSDWFYERREDWSDLAQFSAELDHLQRWADHASALYLPECSRLIWLQAYPQWHFGQYQLAEQTLTKALAIQQDERYHSAAITLADIHNDLGSVYDALGDGQQALSYQQQALALRLELLGDKHPDVARSYSNIGASYGDLGDHSTALDYHQQALTLRLDILGAKHPAVALSYNNIGYSHGELGDHSSALDFYQQALTLRLELFGDKHPDVARSYNNIGATYSDLGDHSTALDFYQQALTLLLELLGGKHPNVAASYHNIATTYHALGQHRQALDYVQQGLQLRSELLGAEHPHTLNSLRGVVISSIALNKFDQARTALYDFEKTIPTGHHCQAELEEGRLYINTAATKAGYASHSKAKTKANTNTKTRAKKRAKRK